MRNSEKIFSWSDGRKPGNTTSVMQDRIHIPCSLRSAAAELRGALSANLSAMSNEDFIRAWAAMAYLFPGLHPDEYDNMDGGWPRVLARFAAEAWSRAEDGEISDGELYQSDAQWCGIYDRLKIRQPDEIQHRLELAAL